MTDKRDFPANWMIGRDFDPNAHMMSLKGKDYLNVQSRLLWFIRDQRALIAAGLATMPYAVHTEIVEMDREHGYAHFKTYVRDVLGNEATMYGSESAKDFPDFAEKASTKSLGRALLSLGYGTGMAPEMDEGERVADSPQERRPQHKAAPAPTQDASNKLAQARTPAHDQTDLARRISEATIGNVGDVKAWVRGVIERDLDVVKLRAGTSDLTMGECSKLLLKLNERANGHPDLSELETGARA